jgi:hypothetical protein
MAKVVDLTIERKRALFEVEHQDGVCVVFLAKTMLLCIGKTVPVRPSPNCSSVIAGSLVRRQN